MANTEGRTAVPQYRNSLPGGIRNCRTERRDAGPHLQGRCCGARCSELSPHDRDGRGDQRYLDIQGCRLSETSSSGWYSPATLDLAVPHRAAAVRRKPPGRAWLPATAARATPGPVIPPRARRRPAPTSPAPGEGGLAGSGQAAYAPDLTMPWRPAACRPPRQQHDVDPHSRSSQAPGAVGWWIVTEDRLGVLVGARKRLRGRQRRRRPGAARHRPGQGPAAVPRRGQRNGAVTAHRPQKIS